MTAPPNALVISQLEMDAESTARTVPVESLAWFATKCESLRVALAEKHVDMNPPAIVWLFVPASPSTVLLVARQPCTVSSTFLATMITPP
jgi:hypothetical protein